MNLDKLQFVAHFSAQEAFNEIKNIIHLNGGFKMTKSISKCASGMAYTCVVTCSVKQV